MIAKAQVDYVITSNVNVQNLDPGYDLGYENLVEGDDVLLVGQTDATENGVVTITAQGAVDRSDADDAADFTESFTVAVAWTGDTYTWQKPVGYTFGDPLVFTLQVVQVVGGAGTVVPLPSGASFSRPITIYRHGPGSYSCSRSAAEYDVARSMVAYASPSGSDSNDGLSASSPKRTASAALTVLTNASPTSGKLVLAPGTYYGGLGSATVTFPLSIICEGGRAYLPDGRPGTDFVLHSGNCYKRVSHALGGAVDLAVRDSFGAPTLYTQASSVANCVATPGTWYLDVADSNTFYLHCLGGRTPDDWVFTVDAATKQVYFNNPAGPVFLKNLTLMGGDQVLIWKGSSSAGVLAAMDCEFVESSNQTYDMVQMHHDAGFVILEWCKAYHSAKDGLNYKYETAYADPPLEVIEIDCETSANGKGAGGTNNGSTLHYGGRIIRINGVHKGNQNRNIHDISTNTISLNFGTIAGEATASGGGGVNAAFACETTGSCKMWCYETDTTTSEYDYWVVDNGTLTLVGVNTTGKTIQVDGNATKTEQTLAAALVAPAPGSISVSETPTSTPPTTIPV